MKFINSFYQAWNDKELDTLNEMIAPNFKGARVYNEETFYHKTDFIDYIKNLSNGYKIKETFHTNGVYYITSTLDEHELQIKMVTSKDKITKYYEILKQKSHRYLCDLSYDGTNYHGFQKQQNLMTIQSRVEDALKQAFGKNIMIHASGRTDKGVHAVHQMFHFDLDFKISEEKVVTVLNHILPKDIIIHNAYNVPQTFHARYDVIKKTYQYKINTGDYNPFEANYMMYEKDLDVQKLNQVLKGFFGTHDFYNFTKNREVNTVRTIYEINAEKKGDFITISIAGNGFLRYMVRYIIGAAIDVVLQKAKFTILDALTTKNKELLKHLADPNGLYLYEVSYQEDIHELSTFDL